MLFEDKTQNNIMDDLTSSVDSDINTGEGTLIDHSFRGAAAEFEKAYLDLGLIDSNGFAETADREHLILRAKERGIVPFAATNAIWQAKFNIPVELDARFQADELTYICTSSDGSTCELTCEQTGTKGNIKQEGLLPVEYIDGSPEGELVKLLVPARDEEDTETFRARYLSIASAAQAFGGNRTQYKAFIHETEGVGACKIYRVTEKEKRIKMYFLNSAYKTPDAALVAKVQEITDPVGRQGEGEGKAPIFHVVDVLPCASVPVNITADIAIDTGYVWEGLLPAIEEKIDNYLLELSKTWENEQHLIVRILKINTTIAGVEGIVDVQNTSVNGVQENYIMGENEIPVRGEICKR